jgi:hypothetical protein
MGQLTVLIYAIEKSKVLQSARIKADIAKQ